jgi:hypothetical protein
MPILVGGSARTRLAALVVLVVVAVPLVILFASAGGDDTKPDRNSKPHHSTGLRVERGTGGSDLTIYVKPAVNVPARAGGRRQVVLKCVDSDGDAVMAQDEAWPFAQTDKGLFEPHAHLVLDPLSITAVERCLLEGTKPLLEGRVP